MSNFVYRKLLESEMSDWFEHCGTIFGRDKQYFVNHWQHDPWASIDCIFVCVDESNGVIASTVRVFHRTIYMDGATTTMGGIGEVCTKEQYRAQGMARKLLELANTYMRENNFTVSFLSASKKNIPFYNKVGFVASKENMTKIKIDSSEPNAYASDVITLGDFNFAQLNEESQEKLMSLYESIAKNYNGPVQRNRHYWMHWVPAWSEETHQFEYSILENGNVIGYIAVSTKNSDNQGSVVQVHDFVVPEKYQSDLEKKKELMMQCFNLIARKSLFVQTDNPRIQFTFRSSMCLNHVLLSEMKEVSEQFCEYSGWMYQFLNDRGNANEQFERNFLMFGVDSF